MNVILTTWGKVAGTFSADAHELGPDGEEQAMLFVKGLLVVS